MRHKIAVFGVALLVLTTGCMGLFGGGESPEATTTTTEDGGDDSDMTPTATTTEGDGSDTSSKVVTDPSKLQQWQGMADAQEPDPFDSNLDSVATGYSMVVFNGKMTYKYIGNESENGTMYLVGFNKNGEPTAYATIEGPIQDGDEFTFTEEALVNADVVVAFWEYQGEQSVVFRYGDDGF